MLVSFTLENFRSFRGPNMLSMVPIRGLNGENTDEASHLINTGHEKIKHLQKSAAIYGANAGGKSNLVSGLMEMRQFVLESLKDINPSKRPRTSPFAFSDDTKNSPSLFEVQVLLDKSLYRYGFEVNRNTVESEWLYRDEQPLFSREFKNFSVESGFEEGKGKDTQTREDALFLSVCHSYNGPISGMIVEEFFKRIRWVNPVPALLYVKNTINNIDDEQISSRLIELVKLAGPGICRFEKMTKKGSYVQYNDESEEEEVIEVDIPTLDVIHECESSNNRLGISEISAGTKKLLSLAGAILRALEDGGIVIVDEIDIQLHSLLIEALLNIFHSKNEKSKAQLIFTTHNTYPLEKKLLRRDQIWFVNKFADLSSNLVNLAEFKLSPDASFEDDYLNGRYGGFRFWKSLKFSK